MPAWIDTNGCPTGFHELRYNAQGSLICCHVDGIECPHAEFNLSELLE